MSQTLSPRQVDVAAAMLRHQRRHGYPMTTREIGDAVGISSTNGVNDHIRALVRKGVVVQTKAYASRSYRVLDPALDALRVAMADAPEGTSVAQLLRASLGHRSPAATDEDLADCFRRTSEVFRTGSCCPDSVEAAALWLAVSEVAA